MLILGFMLASIYVLDILATVFLIPKLRGKELERAGPQARLGI